MKKILLLLIVMAGFTLSLAAQKVVTGKVTDVDLNPLGGSFGSGKRDYCCKLTDAEF
jgi:hypothetical protein